MALTANEKRLVAKHWIRIVFKDTDTQVCIHYADLTNAKDNSQDPGAIDEADAWVDAAPGGGASNAQSFIAAINSGFKTKLTNGGVASGSALATLFGLIAMARAGNLPGQ